MRYNIRRTRIDALCGARGKQPCLLCEGYMHHTPCAVYHSHRICTVCPLFLCRSPFCDAANGLIYYCNYKQSEEMYDLFCQFGLFLNAPQHQIKNILMYVVIYVVNCIFHSLVKHILHIYLTFPILLRFTLVLYSYFGSVHRRR